MLVLSAVVSPRWWYGKDSNVTPKYYGVCMYGDVGAEKDVTRKSVSRSEIRGCTNKQDVESAEYFANRMRQIFAKRKLI